MSKTNKKKLPLLPQVLAGLVLCFTIFVFAPIDMYLLNSSNFWFSLEHFVPLFCLLFAVAFVVVELLFLLFRKLPRPLYLLLLALLAGVTVCLYLQGNFLCMTNEVLGGDTPQWAAMLKPALINLIIWCAVMLFFLGFMIIKPRIFMKAVSAVCALILVAEGSALTVSLINHAGGEYTTGSVYYGDDDHFTFSTQGDVLVFMMDTLDTRLFDRMMEENPEYLTELHGFTYYRNASSSFRKTDPSFVSILTGHICRNERPFFIDADKAFMEGRFLPALKNAGMTVNIYAGPAKLFTRNTVSQVDNLVLSDAGIGSRYAFTRVMLGMVAYRYAPTVLQPFFFADYAASFEQCRVKITGEAGSTFYANGEVRDAFRAKGVTIDDSRRFFKFYTFQGSHTPYDMNRFGETVESGSSNSYEQTLGSFAVLNEILFELKENDVYDNATIIILADHGNGWICNPTLLVKYPQSDNGTLIISDAPVELLDVRATAMYGAGLPYEEHGTPVHMWEGVTERDRLFYAYDWVKPEGFSFYLNELTEYVVPADATDVEAYEPTGNTFAPR